jgi:hypothetical protein
MVVYKTRAERVQEAVTLLKKLQEIGVHVSDPGYKQAKAFLDVWIKDGEEASHEFWFARYGRKAVIDLPKRVERAATLRILAADTTCKECKQEECICEVK